MPPHVSRISHTYKDLVSLPSPKGKIRVSVYSFRDMTGQYKPQPNVSSFSTAVTQGAVNILLEALKRSKWFIPVERDGLQSLLTERKIIAAANRKNGAGEAQLPALEFANVLLQGGITAYETNTLTGGFGARYFGIGGSTQYRMDQVTVHLRAVDVNSGRILKSISTTKTIFSYEVDAGVFQFISYKKLLEIEAGFSQNEPVQMCVAAAIEKAVIAMVIEGVQDGLWALKDPEQINSPVFKDYEEESQRLATEAELKRVEAKAAAVRKAKYDSAALEKFQAEQAEKQRIEAEAKAEQEAKQRMEAEAKAEEQAKQRMEAEAKAEQEAKQRMEAEAKAEQEAKLRMEAAAKAEQEEKQRIEAEAKAEQEAKQRMEAEAKAEQEEKLRMEAAAKAEQEEKLRMEAAAKAEQEEKLRMEAAAKAEQAEKQRIEAEAKAEQASAEAQDQPQIKKWTTPTQDGDALPTPQATPAREADVEGRRGVGKAGQTLSRIDQPQAAPPRALPGSEAAASLPAQEAPSAAGAETDQGGAPAAPASVERQESHNAASIRLASWMPLNITPQAAQVRLSGLGI
ncbi:CsgG/HfaB family protein [Desulfoferula mesophila]